MQTKELSNIFCTSNVNLQMLLHALYTDKCLYLSNYFTTQLLNG